MARVLGTLVLAAFTWLLLAATDPAKVVAPELPETVHLKRWHFGRGFRLEAVPEPSGLCFVAERNSLFIVDDGDINRPAAVSELSLDAEVLQKQAVGFDLEGICYCTADGLLYIADENAETVWVLEPANLAVHGSFTVSRSFAGDEVLAAGGNGFEGIEYIASTRGCERDYFLLLNQDDPQALVRVNRSDITLGATVPMAGFCRLPEINCGELWYDQPTEELWVVHSWENVYQVLDIGTLAVKAWYACPGAAQEAVTKDAQGRLWIGSDSGGLAYYTNQPAP